MGEILTGATLVEFSPPRAERADLRIEGGRIVARGRLEATEEDRVTNLEGRLIIPGLVSAHTHLYASLWKGLAEPKPLPKSFSEMCERLWWRLDAALDLHAVEIAAAVGAVEALLSGVTCVVDHHSSPAAITGSLATIRKAVEGTGIRAALSYEVTDRQGPEAAALALRETESFLSAPKSSRVLGFAAGHASYTLQPATLEALVALAAKHDTWLLLHAAECGDDEHWTRKRWDKGVMRRLVDAGAVGKRTLLVHGTHLVWQELSEALLLGAWMVHCPRASAYDATGYAQAASFGTRRALGTSFTGLDMWAELQFAYLKSLEQGMPIDPASWLASGHSLATELFGLPIGPLEPGAAADLVVLDYPASTPVLLDNLSGHLGMCISSSHVDSVMVDGVWRLWARQPLSLDYAKLRARAREAAALVWARMA